MSTIEHQENYFNALCGGEEAKDTLHKAERDLEIAKKSYDQALEKIIRTRNRWAYARNLEQRRERDAIS